MTEDASKDTKLNRYDQLMIEGYRSLGEWNCQQSEDHLTFDKVFMPVIIGAPILALNQGEIRIATFTLVGGVLLLLFWFFRNLRSKMRIYETFNMMNDIEKELKFDARTRLRDKIDNSRLPSDFGLKKWFFGFAVAFYLVVFLFVLKGYS